MDSTTHTSASRKARKLAKDVWGRVGKTGSTLAGMSRKFSDENNDPLLIHLQEVREWFDNIMFRAPDHIDYRGHRYELFDRKYFLPDRNDEVTVREIWKKVD